MTHTKSKVVLLALVTAIFATALMLLNVTPAGANALQFVPTVQSASATTTLFNIQPGFATTTLTYDANSLPGGFAADKAVLFVQFHASTSISTLNINVEYSQDGQDWYQNGDAGFMKSATTSFSTFFVSTSAPTYSWQFASTTAGLAAPSSIASTTHRAFVLETPTRFIRAVFSVPIGSASSSIWAQIVPIKQRIVN